MRKIEYRCYHCMIVETKWLLNIDNGLADYIACRKCGLESKRIGTEKVSQPSNFARDELEHIKGRVSELLQRSKIV